MINWAALAALASMGAFFAVVLGCAYVYGKLTESVSANAKALTELRIEHSKRLDDLDDASGAHDVAIGKLQEWKDGFNAGSRSATKEV